MRFFSRPDSIGIKLTRDHYIIMSHLVFQYVDIIFLSHDFYYCSNVQSRTHCAVNGRTEQIYHKRHVLVWAKQKTAR